MRQARENKREREKKTLFFSLEVTPLCSLSLLHERLSRPCSSSARLPRGVELITMHCRATSHASAGPRIAASGGFSAAAPARAQRQRAVAAAAAAASVAPSSSSTPDEPRRPLDPSLAAAAQGQAGPSSQRMPRPPSAVATSPSDSARASTDAIIGAAVDAADAEDNDANSVVVVAPEDFVLPPGVLGPVADKSKPLHPADIYRCSGCTKPECQVREREFGLFFSLVIFHH